LGDTDYGEVIRHIFIVNTGGNLNQHRRVVLHDETAVGFGGAGFFKSNNAAAIRVIYDGEIRAAVFTNISCQSTSHNVGAAAGTSGNLYLNIFYPFGSGLCGAGAEDSGATDSGAVLDLLLAPPHAVRARSIASARISAKNFFMKSFSLLIIFRRRKDHQFFRSDRCILCMKSL
jgi:hypothetical protein